MRRRTLLKSIAGSFVMWVALRRPAFADDCDEDPEDCGWPTPQPSQPAPAQPLPPEPPVEPPDEPEPSPPAVIGGGDYDPGIGGDPSDVVGYATGGNGPAGTLVYNATGGEFAGTDGFTFSVSAFGGDGLAGAGLSDDAGGFSAGNDAAYGGGSRAVTSGNGSQQRPPGSRSTGDSSGSAIFGTGQPQTVAQEVRAGDYRDDAIQYDPSVTTAATVASWLAKHALKFAVPETVSQAINIAYGTEVKSTTLPGIAAESTARTAVSIAGFAAGKAAQVEFGVPVAAELFMTGFIIGGPVGAAVAAAGVAVYYGTEPVADWLVDKGGETIIDLTMELPEATERLGQAMGNLEQNLYDFYNPVSGPGMF